MTYDPTHCVVTYSVAASCRSQRDRLPSSDSTSTWRCEPRSRIWRHSICASRAPIRSSCLRMYQSGDSASAQFEGKSSHQELLDIGWKYDHLWTSKFPSSRLGGDLLVPSLLSTFKVKEANPRSGETKNIHGRRNRGTGVCSLSPKFCPPPNILPTKN